MYKDLIEKILEKRLWAILDVHKKDLFYDMLMDNDFIAHNYYDNTYDIKPIEEEYQNYLRYPLQ